MSGRRMLTRDEVKAFAIELAAAMPPAPPDPRRQTASTSQADYDDTFLAAVDLEKVEALLQLIMDGAELPASMRTVLIVVREHVDAALARLKANPVH